MRGGEPFCTLNRGGVNSFVSTSPLAARGARGARQEHEADHAGVCAPDGSVGANRQPFAPPKPTIYGGLCTLSQTLNVRFTTPVFRSGLARTFVYAGLAPADDEGRYVSYTRHIERTKSHKSPQAVAIVLPDTRRRRTTRSWPRTCCPPSMEAFVEHSELAAPTATPAAPTPSRSHACASQRGVGANLLKRVERGGQPYYSSLRATEGVSPLR